jgi:phosphoglycerol transferase MdoB-like AlkP superfamily enzyme
MKYVLSIFDKLPRLVQFLLVCVSLNLFVLTIFRLIFWGIFNVPQDALPFSVLLKSFYIGFKFDLRLTLLIYSPVLLLAWIKPVDVFRTNFGRWLWTGYLTAVNLMVLLFYFLDLGHYEYLQTRVDATVLRFLYNAKESFQMILESYPVFWGLVIFAALIIAHGSIIKLVISKIGQGKTTNIGKWKKAAILTLSVIIYLFGIYGKISYYPLRWSDAFFSTYEFASAIALNPVLYFFDTFKNKDVKYDLATVTKNYDLIASYLGVTHPDEQSLNFTRSKGKGTGPYDRFNVIMVFLESFTYYKTGISGNPLNPTPNFDTMAKDSILFRRFYTPHGGTARSVFTAISGIPDVEINKTSSRNPLVVRQHTIVNAFEGYDKLYFLGGSANWGEIRGLLSHNIAGLRVFEEGSYSSPRLDVWGISDLHLFEEANQVLRKINDTPFFAIIQTSGNHKPYTIPEDHRGFQPVSADPEEVVKYGFRSVDAYNAFRFLDHSVGIFLKAAQREAYFKNTIFVFFGDHGLIRSALHMHKAEDQLLLTRYHVPLVIYAPGLIREGKIFDKVASEVDVLPTIARIASIPYVNSTLGRDLLDDRYDTLRYAFTIRHKYGPEIGLIGDQYVFLTDVAGTKKRLHKIYSDTPRENVIGEFPEVAAKLERLCRGLYETARYMRFHNSPETVTAQSKFTN